MASTEQEVGPPDKARVSAVIAKLYSNSAKEVFEALIEIRSNIIKTNAGIKLFHQCGGLKCLVRSLQTPNQKNLDVSLSILANCCLDYEVRKEAGDFNVSALIISILRKIEVDAISGRACRVLGNLAQDYTVARQLHENGAVDALLATLSFIGSGTPSISTRQMAVRALGALWCVPDLRHEMLRKNVVRTIAVMLTTETAPQMLEQIFKVLIIFTKTPSQQCASQVNAEGSGFQHLVACTSNATLKDFALTCIGNLCDVASSRPLLGNAGAVDVLVTEVQLNRSEPLLRALCQLSHEAVNRAKIRELGGLQILLTEARTRGRCLKSLEHYVYDEPSLTLLLKAGLLPLLIDLLANCKPPEYCNSNQKQKKEDLQPRMNPRITMSPDSAVDTMSPSTSPYMSPGSSGSGSPSYYYPMNSPLAITDVPWEQYQREKMENYSPVCSDDETDDEDTTGEGRGQKKKKKKKKGVGFQVDVEPVLILLSRISHMETSIVNMASSKILTALLNYLLLDQDPHSRAGRILGRLCRNPLNFIHILLANFVPLVYSKMISGGVHYCLGITLLSQLSAVAESSFGVGEVTHHLIKSSSTHKEIISFALPYLLKEPRLMKKLLLDYGGLSILLQVLDKTWNEDLTQECHNNTLQFLTTGICVLAKSLDMSFVYVSTCPHTIPDDVELPEEEDSVCFELDCGAQVVTRKTLLCQQSPYFAAMFGGQFSEARQARINLPEITEECMQDIIILMLSGSLPIYLDLKRALELLKALDRFLIPVEPDLLKTILRFLTLDSAKSIYEHALVSGNSPLAIILKQNILKYILSSTHEFESPKKRIDTFTEFGVHFGNEFLDNIETLFSSEIKSKYDVMYKMKCRNSTGQE